MKAFRRAGLPIILSAVVCAVLAGAGLNHALSGATTDQPQAFSERAIVLPNVALVDHEGKAHRLLSEIAQGSIIVINFNYTTCESICPVGNALMQMVDQHAPASFAKPVKLLSITIDPRRDTQEVMSKTASEFGPSSRWLWLTGEPRDVDAVLRSAGASTPNIELHTPLFLVGDAERGVFYSIRAQPDVEDIIEVLERLSS
ncbi:SCO family protein [Mesorhizobium sp. A623]